jgi:hypothetical protein
MDSPEWHSAASEPRDFVGVELGQSRDPIAIAVVRRIKPPAPVPEDARKPKPCYAPGSLERRPFRMLVMSRIRHAADRGERRAMEVMWGNRLKPGDYKYIRGFLHFVAERLFLNPLRGRPKKSGQKRAAKISRKSLPDNNS